MEVKIDVWIILFIAATAQGMFLTLMLFQRAKGRQLVLASLMLLFTVTIAYYVTFWTGISQHISRHFQIILTFIWLFGPLFYGYARSEVQHKLPKSLWVHLLPFLLVNMAVYLVPLFNVSFRYYGLFTSIGSFHVLGYALGTYWMLRKSKVSKSLLLTSFSFLGYAICLISYYVLSWTGVLQLTHDYLVSIGMTVFIYLIGYRGFKNPNLINSKQPNKYQKSLLSHQSLLDIMKKVDALLIDEKLFLDGELKLSSISQKTGFSSHDISQAINVIKGHGFSDYVNKMRVDQAVLLMNSSAYEKEKLIAIAFESGFNNKTSFLNAFKKHTGRTPSEFRKSIYSQAS
ncbi:helix-turn-helix domain-containing protein [Roseivirga misakiensis]|uniref:HTH araC/xylS-type domain-containing protein n=1 Tax=Roseivirga misakiensis TaxID=1563681 RepID=A0A1E5T0T7_9BACT|nr:AraC family transcriptional regulator [Roseivirga misakiensis]OEK04917.1 hypothetical protein BFP71_15895 [Roseivirga misakiensis]